MSILEQANARAAELSQGQARYDPLRDVGNVTESFGRGMSAGVYGMGSSLRNALGGAADAFDFDDFAAQQYGEADRLAQKAAQVGPRVSSLEQLGNKGYSLRNVGDYALGIMGGAVPSMAVGLGASALSGGALLPSLAAGTLAYTPMEVGDAVAKYRAANPGQEIDGSTMTRLGLTGGLSAGAQSVVPGLIGAKLAGKGIASMPATTMKQAVGRNLGGIPMEGATEGLGEYIKQTGATPDQATDWGQIGENAVAGMIGGAPMAGLGAVGDYAHGNAQKVSDLASSASKSLGSKLDRAGEAVEGLKTPVEKGFGDAWTALSEMGESAWKGVSESDLGKAGSERVAKMRQRAEEILADPTVPAEWKAKVEKAAKGMANNVNAAIIAAVDNTRAAANKVREDGIVKASADGYRAMADKIINAEYLGDPKDLDGSDESVRSKLDQSVRKATAAAKAFGEDLMRRAGIDPEARAEVEQAMGDPSQPANQQTLAAKWKLYEAKDAIVKKAENLAGRFKKGFREGQEGQEDSTKKSEDYSGVRQTIGLALRPHMDSINEAIGKDPQALGKVADSLRLYIEGMTDTKGRLDEADRFAARTELISMLGDKLAVEVMADVASQIGLGGAREKTESVFAEVNELQTLQKEYAGLRKLMSGAAPKDQRGEVEKDLYRVMEWAAGSGVAGDKKDVSQAEIKFRNQKLEMDLTARYGSAKTKAIFGAVEKMLTSRQQDYNPEAERQDAERDGIDYEDALTEREAPPKESLFFGSGKDRKTLVKDPAVHAIERPEWAGKGKADDVMKALQIENPGAKIRFVSLVDRPEMLDSIPAEKRAVTLEAKRLEKELPGEENSEARQQALQKFRDGRVAELKKDGMGMIEVVRGTSDERLTAAEIEDMRMDTQNYGSTDHPSRLEVAITDEKKKARIAELDDRIEELTEAAVNGHSSMDQDQIDTELAELANERRDLLRDHIFDAVKVTKAMTKRINRERTWTKGDDIDAVTRMARAFSDGVAALTEKFGRIKVTPDLVIGAINGKPITAVEALKYDKRTDKDVRVDAQTMEAVDVRKRLKEVSDQSKQTTNKETLRELREEYKDLKFRLKTLEMAREGRVNTDLAAKTTEDMEQAVRTIDKRLSSEENITVRRALEKERDYLTGRLESAYEREFADKQHQDGAREDADPNGNIHQAAARLNGDQLQARLNMDGSTKTSPPTYVANAKPLVTAAMRVAKAGGIGEAMARRMMGLAFNFAAVSREDQRKLTALKDAEKPSDVGTIVSAMATKYASALTLTKAQTAAVSDMLDALKEGTDRSQAYIDVSQANSVIRDRVAKADLEGLTKMLAEHQRRLARYEAGKSRSDAVVRVMEAMASEIDLMQSRLEDLRALPANTKAEPQRQVGGRGAGEYSDPLIPWNTPNAKFEHSPEGAKARGVVKEGTDTKIKARARSDGAFGERSLTTDQIREKIASLQVEHDKLSSEMKSLDKDLKKLQELDKAVKPFDAGSFRNAELDALKKELARREGTPDPKARAAQEAALQQATSAGDAPAILQALVARFAPDMQIKIGDGAPRGNGHLAAHADGTFTVSLKEGLTPVQVASTLTHEFGHALMRHKFDAAPATVRNEIMAAYRADVDAAKGGSVQELTEKFGHVAGRISVDGRQQTAAEMIAKRDAKAGWEGYTLSFDEWFANQVSKYATSGGFESLSPEAKGFWQQVLQTLKDVYRALTKEMRPAPSFEQWMNQLAKQAELRVTEKQERVLREAIEGDKALIGAMTASTDVQKLQRVVGFLSNFGGMGKVDDVIGAANNRIRELVKDEGQAYHAQTRKYSLLSTQIHNDLGREGFAATHDSPHRHGGWFNWRAYLGMGEGNAAFGAGTYLSTAEGVHRSYKDQFTAQVQPEHNYEVKERIVRALRAELRDRTSYLDEAVSIAVDEGLPKAIESLEQTLDDVLGSPKYEKSVRALLEKFRTMRENDFAPSTGDPTGKSPTYEVSVNIKPEELLDWDKPLSEQSELVQKALAGTRVSFLDESYPGKGEMGGQKIVRTWTNGGDALHLLADDTYMFEPWDGGPERVSTESARTMYDPTGREIYESLVGSGRSGKVTYDYGKALGSQAAASDYLQSLGILGHRYAASGGKNDTHPNYVIYDDSKITTNYVHFSNERIGAKQYPNVGPAEPLSAKAIRDHLFKVLGDTVQVEFANLMYAGDFTRQLGEDIIRISVHALNPTTVAYHESLHAFFAQLRDKGLPDVVNAVYKGLNSPHVMRQLRERLKDSPEALAQLADPEERAAYAYQFWASDPTFKLTAAPRTVFEKIAAAIRKVLGIWSNDERALEIFKYFHSGKYQQQSGSKLAIHTATMRAGRNGTLDTAKNLVKPITNLGDALVGAGGERLRDSGVPSLVKMANIIKRKGTEEGRDAGYIPAARYQRTKHLNWLANALKDYNQADLAEALEAMQEGVKAKSTSARIIQKIVREKYLREMMYDEYLTKAGVKLGDLGPDYFPRVWDPVAISKNEEKFIEMLQSYGVKNADVIVDKIVSGAGTEFGFDNAQIEIERPGFVNSRERKLAFISGADATPFLQKDFWATMDSYTTQATRRGEWSRRFGYDNTRFDALLAEARDQGATDDQIKMAEDYAKAVNGTLGDDIDPNWRLLQGNMIVYQNVRLLPLAIFSSVVDPLGIIVRGGTVRDSWDSFKRGVKELRKSWQKDPTFDGDTALAEQLGTIENAMLQHTISSMYGQGMMGETAQKVNDLFFRYNFMEGWNRSVRVGATQAAIGFIKRHVQNPGKHSERYLAELGLKADEVKFGADGQLVFDERTKKAINRWVDGAVLRPDAADTPIWMHDPHYAIFAHLKQFAFAFHHTFLKRVWHEYKHGNYKPLMALGSFVPVMMAADFLKDMLANGGDEPEWKKGWTLMDHAGYGMERAGIFGVGQFVLDGLGDIRNGGTGIGALAGPTVDQLTDAVQVLGGRREFGSFALRSMPANSLYRGYLGEQSEMEFEGDSVN